MDVNGFKGPNSEVRNGKQYDIRSFKTARFSTGCAGVEVPNIGCVYQLPSYSPIKGGSEEMKKWDPEYAAKYTAGFNDDNYWAGAKKTCGELGMSLPDISKLQSLAKKTIQEKEQLGLPTEGSFWTSSEDDFYHAYYVSFSNSKYAINYFKAFGGFPKLLCIGN